MCCDGQQAERCFMAGCVMLTLSPVQILIPSVQYSQLRSPSYTPTFLLAHVYPLFRPPIA